MRGRFPAIGTGTGNQAMLAAGRPSSTPQRGWQWVRLADVARLESGHTPSRARDAYWGGTIPWIGIPDAREHNGQPITTTHQTVTEAGVEHSAARILPAGTVCVSRTASIGYVVEMARPMTTSQDFANWVCGPAVHPRFLLHVLAAERETLLSLAKGSTHQTIYFPTLRDFYVCLPPVEHQHAVAAELDELLAACRGIRASLSTVPGLQDELRSAVLAAAVSGDLLVRTKPKATQAKSLDAAAAGHSPRVTALGLPELPAEWRWATLEEISPVPIVYGIIQAGENVPDGVPYIRPMDITSEGAINADSLQRTSHAIAKRYSRSMLATGDVILSIVGTIGKTAIVPRELHGANITQSSVRIRPAKDMPALYLVYALKSPSLVRQYARYRFGNAVERLNVAHVRKLVIPVPPQQQMRRIVDHAESLLRKVREAAAPSMQRQLQQLEAGIYGEAFQDRLIPLNIGVMTSLRSLLSGGKPGLGASAMHSNEGKMLSKEEVKDRIRMLRPGPITWDGLKKHLASDYDITVDALFELLTERSSPVRQLFDTKKASIAIKRVKP